MDEREWLASAGPMVMLAHLWPDSETGRIISERKLRLWVVACCRQVWHHLTDERSRRAVEVAERYADGKATDQQLYAASNCLDLEVYHSRSWLWAYVATEWEPARRLLGRGRTPTPILDEVVPPADQAALLRDLVGNPWRPVPVRKPCGVLLAEQACAAGRPFTHFDNCPACRGAGVVAPPWLTPPPVLSIARAAYAKRLPDGFLDPSRLAVLSDALEEAGCVEETILRHLRGEVRESNDGGRAYWYTDASGPQLTPDRARAAHVHARGCWAMDLLLGRE
jgi:hypothetical protein